MITMTPEQCATEALRRLTEADEVFEQYRTLPAELHQEDRMEHAVAAHLRQTAAVYATLALAGRYTPSRAGDDETLS
jgi:hypothetical protein